jgi:7-carboxy-7-deazaguanine synthase
MGVVSDSLRINEIFHSIQGESTWAGCPCVFVRLTGCPLRCSYCDTEYAFREGTSRPLEDVVQEVHAIGCPLVEVTGGEPLAQRACATLVLQLLDLGHTVLVETSGAMDTSVLDPRTHIILDVKTPGSGEHARNLASNISHLRPHDEVKFVITDRADYDFAKSMMAEHGLADRCRAVLLSPVFEQAKGLEILGARALSPRTLAEWMLADRLPARMNLQLHKFIWEPSTRGV